MIGGIVRGFNRALPLRARPNRVDRGLYGGREKQFGNKIAKKFKNKSRRWWNPNVIRNKRLYSEILDKEIRINVTTKVLRELDRFGGLDNYILNSTVTALDSEYGLKLRAELKEQLRLNRYREKQRAIRDRMLKEQGLELAEIQKLVIE